MGRHRTIGVLPFLGRIRKTAAEFARGKLQYSGASLTVLYDGIALATIVGAACLLHKQTFNTRFLRLALHNGTTSFELKA
jgi:hypothetical protein